VSRLPLPPRALVYAWVALLVLVGVNLGVAYIPLGAANPAIALAIAAAQALVVALVLMKLWRAVPLSRIFAITGVFWLLLLFGLSLTDYATRPIPGFAASANPEELGRKASP
jgi:cytochrome c oxidase subunit IV